MAVATSTHSAKQVVGFQEVPPSQLLPFGSDGDSSKEHACVSWESCAFVKRLHPRSYTDDFYVA